VSFPKILHCRFQVIERVPETAQPQIAIRAQQSSHFACLVIVIDGEPSIAWRRIEANRAHPALRLEHALVVFEKDTESPRLWRQAGRVSLGALFTLRAV
jgi:hypothetical protein